MMGQPLISDPIEIAAAYLDYLCNNQPFFDGNKRVALAACLVVFSANGWASNEVLDIDAWESLTLGVAADTLTRSGTTGACATCQSGIKAENAAKRCGRGKGQAILEDRETACLKFVVVRPEGTKALKRAAAVDARVLTSNA